MKPALPVYNINDFCQYSNEQEFYVNDFKNHIQNHHFINHPHKHDFYLCIFFTNGSGTHHIDFNAYVVNAGSVFVLKPGQSHHWTLSEDCDGFVFFHSKSFFNLNFNHLQINDFPFFSSNYNNPKIVLNQSDSEKLTNSFNELLSENKQNSAFKISKIGIILADIYINLSRLYQSNIQIKYTNQNYISKLRSFENLLEQHFKTLKSATAYADLMNISTKHLNRVCSECINKSTSEIITDRIILEAKRLLSQESHSISDIANQLGYDDTAYFGRLFKKHCKASPIQFRTLYKV